ncbi:MAG: type II toxin-antitoxin system VapC family toxin [Armatimonadetes bacterium]|nr:type II toxin-antitoxin system VapC family toxin [Armatimonadota bacterium]
MLIDTQLWIWWVNGASQLKPEYAKAISEATSIEVSIISCWEIAKLAEYGRLVLAIPTLEWLNRVLSVPKVHLLPLTPSIVADSTKLPDSFHKDPADQLIVATARVCNLPLLTMGLKIIAYPHVRLAI